MKSLINTVNAEMKDIVDLRVKWEFLKYKIRQFTLGERNWREDE